MNFEYGTESWRRIPYSSNAGLFCIVETKQVQEKTSRLHAVSSTIGMLISDNDTNCVSPDISYTSAHSPYLTPPPEELGCNHERLQKMMWHRGYTTVIFASKNAHPTSHAR